MGENNLIRLNSLNPSSVNFLKWSNTSVVADEWFEWVWPFWGVGSERINIRSKILKRSLSNKDTRTMSSLKRKTFLNKKILALDRYQWYCTSVFHCVKSVRIRSYSGPHFSRISPHSEGKNPGKMGTRITPNTDTFYAVFVVNKEHTEPIYVEFVLVCLLHKIRHKVKIKCIGMNRLTINGIIYGRFTLLKFFCPPPFIHVPQHHFKKKLSQQNWLRINCGRAFVWEKIYHLESSNSSGDGNVLLIKMKIKCLAGQNLEIMTFGYRKTLVFDKFFFKNTTLFDVFIFEVYFDN